MTSYDIGRCAYWHSNLLALSGVCLERKIVSFLVPVVTAMSFYPEKSHARLAFTYINELFKKIDILAWLVIQMECVYCILAVRPNVNVGFIGTTLYCAYYRKHLHSVVCRVHKASGGSFPLMECV